MTDWTEGYVSDVTYTMGYYQELSPRHLSLAAAVIGVEAPDPDKPFTYCELGCGQGYSLAIHAATHPHARFVGIDFNPAQIANARSLAEEAGLDNVTFLEESFATARSRGAEGEFDFVVLHGIYTWVSPENRAYIVDFLQRRLKPGGLVYVSYNCMPGWAAATPLQRLLREHAARHPDRSDRQIASGLALLRTLADLDLHFFKNTAGIGARIDKMGALEKNYLVHEYMHAAWEPLYVTDVARDMERAKLTLAGSATLLENLETFSAPPKAREYLAGLSDPLMKALLSDYAVNRQFRRDLYVKGHRPLTQMEKTQRLSDLRFTATKPLSALSLEFDTPVGKGTGQEEVYRPVAKAVMAGRPSVREVMEATGLASGTLLQAMVVLAGNGQIAPVTLAKTAAPARALNKAIIRRAVLGSGHRVVASPVVGRGVVLNDVEMIALDLLAGQKDRSIDALCAGVVSVFQSTGRGLMKDGAPVTDPQAIRTEITARVTRIAETMIPLWRALGLL